MTGPFPLGSLTVGELPQIFEVGRVVRGGHYRVTRPFTDFDGTLHPQGEEWSYIGSWFERDNDHFTLCVRSDSGLEWAIELGCNRRHPDQADVITNFLEYFAPVGPDGIARPVPRDKRIRHMRIFTMTPAAASQSLELCARNSVGCLRVTAGHFGSEINGSVQPESNVDANKDFINEFNGFSVVFDMATMFALRGVTIDWRETHAGGWFIIPPEKLDPLCFLRQ
jgi:Fe-S cluster assembly iron-binding protein IscA